MRTKMLDPDFEAWHDPLGTVPANFELRPAELWRLEADGAVTFAEAHKTPQEVAPTFCEYFGQNVYMVWKYLAYAYPIRKERAFMLREWLFPPAGPPHQEDLVALAETRPCPASLFRSPWASERPFHRAARIERVLRWAQGLVGRQLAELRKKGANLEGNLTEVDDRLVELVVSYLMSQCAGLPADRISFIPGGQSGRSAEFYVDAPDLRAVVEVKHLLPFAQSEQDDLWLKAFRRDAKPPRTGPVDALLDAVQARLRSVPEGETVRGGILPEQKRTEHIVERLRSADEQLGASKRGGCGVIVLYADDPYTLSSSQAPGSAALVNRSDEAVLSCLGALRHADAIALLAHEDCFPIGSGHSCKLFAPGDVPPEARRLFHGLLEPVASDRRHVMLALQTTLPSNGSRTVTIRNE